MEKRLFLAVVLSIVVLAAWSALLPRPQHLANQVVTTKTTPDLSKEATALSQEAISPTPKSQPGPQAAPSTLFNFSQIKKYLYHCQVG
jgi:hypothetical protein